MSTPKPMMLQSEELSWQPTSSFLKARARTATSRDRSQQYSVIESLRAREDKVSKQRSQARLDCCKREGATMGTPGSLTQLHPTEPHKKQEPRRPLSKSHVMLNMIMRRNYACGWPKGSMFWKAKPSLLCSVRPGPWRQEHLVFVFCFFLR